MTDNTATDPAKDAGRPQTEGRSYVVPSAIDGPIGLDEEFVTAASIEAACQWDERIWRRGLLPR